MANLITFLYSGYSWYAFILLLGIIPSIFLYFFIDDNQNNIWKRVVLGFAVTFTILEVLCLLVGFQFIGTLPHTYARYLVSKTDRDDALSSCPDIFSERRVVESSDCKLAKAAQSKIDNENLLKNIIPFSNDAP